jgi:hypothetical protein
MTNPTSPKPSPADIAVAIGRAESGDWLDPEASPVDWLCRLYDRAGQCVGDGNADTAWALWLRGNT